MLGSWSQAGDTTEGNSRAFQGCVSVGCSAALSAAKLETDGWDTYVLNTSREG